MGNYDFSSLPDRRGTDSLKWEESSSLPMWVADMDFAVAPAIEKAIRDRAAFPSFGYTIYNDDFLDSYRSFWKDVYDYGFKREDMLFAWGVIPIVSSSVKAFSKEGEKVVILTPVYHIFFHSVENNNREVLEVPLKRVDHDYEIPWEELEKAFADPKATVCLFCNPHNPIGKIWSKEELHKVAELALKYNVTVVSDEIHGPLTDPDSSYIPYFKAHEEAYKKGVMAISPTKSFSLAGLQTAMAVVPDKKNNELLSAQLNRDEVNEGNAFSYIAAIAAFRDSRDWLKECREYLYNNKEEVKRFLKEELPELWVSECKATYLMWINIEATGLDADSFTKLLDKECALRVSSGSVFKGDGDKFIRLNVATSLDNVKEGLHRLKKGYELAKERK